MKTLNDLLLHTIRSITKENKEEVIAMVKDVIIPAMAKKLSGEKPVQTVKKTVQTVKKTVQSGEKTVQTVKKTVQSGQSVETEQSNSLIPVQSGNGHKSEKVNALEEWEKDLIRNEFIKLNGEILRDTCLDIKKKLNKDTAIFQVTGFVSLLHKYVLKGEINLPCLDRYYNFQYLKKHGEEEYRQTTKSNSQVMTITHN